MTSTGALRTVFSIQRNVASTDWSGHAGAADWQTQFTLLGAIVYRNGGETVLAGRLMARQTAVLTMLNSPSSRAILPSDRAVDSLTGEIFNIREKPRPGKNPVFVEALVETGAT